MAETCPTVRNDLEFLPVPQGDRTIILIRDPLGLVKEGQGIDAQLYEFMTLLDGTRTARDLQLSIMRQRGGVLVGLEEIERLLNKLDAAFMLDSDSFQVARRRMIETFCSTRVRNCSHCGRSYPDNPAELSAWLDRILQTSPGDSIAPENVTAVVAPHIDPTAGTGTYAAAYGALLHVQPTQLVVMGTGHQLGDTLFCLTSKDFETPLGTARNAVEIVERLEKTGGAVFAADDFAHKTEHAIEFQLIFLQHLLKSESFRLIPILCGSFLAGLSEYRRQVFLDRAGPLLEALKALLQDPAHRTLVVAGVDFSHVGPKFGHAQAAVYLENQAKAHDQELLQHLCALDAEDFWRASAAVSDRYNVCGFSTLATLLEILPSCRGQILDYQLRHESATQSAVGFAAAVFTSEGT